MIVDGRAIADRIKTEVARCIVDSKTPPRLAIIACQPTPETKTFIAKKITMAEQLGVVITRHDMAEGVELEDVHKKVQSCILDNDGVIIQLPFPHLKSDALLSLIPQTYDVDVSRYDGNDTTILPPVIGAIDEISRQHNIKWSGKKVVIVGYGRLVGKPAELYAIQKGASVTLITEELSYSDALHAADIVVLGAGVPGLLQPSMVSPGVVVFDAGTSEEGGVLYGDADPAISEIASLCTPVPGGIGPITVAVLFRNLLQLKNIHHQY
jgi:methylenetetrahydrofolate dehydrogenase (NADP+) / methenyltetrahydrofolate cyclohydrolase